MPNLRNWLQELRRRRVFRVAGMYIVAAWVGVQVASLVFPAVDIADAALRYVWIGFILAFPLVMVFAWLYDITPEGIKRTPAAGTTEETVLRLRRSDYAILAVLAAVVAAMVFELSDEIRDFTAGSTPGPEARGLDARTIAVRPAVPRGRHARCLDFSAVPRGRAQGDLQDLSEAFREFRQTDARNRPGTRPPPGTRSGRRWR